jgi:hypothetical protein
MFYATFVAIYELSAEIAVYFVQVKAVVSGKKGFDEGDVLPYFVDVSGAAGVVSGCLYAAGECFVAFETHYVVGLPAVE